MSNPSDPTLNYLNILISELATQLHDLRNPKSTTLTRNHILDEANNTLDSLADELTIIFDEDPTT